MYRCKVYLLLQVYSWPYKKREKSAVTDRFIFSYFFIILNIWIFQRFTWFSGSFRHCNQLVKNVGLIRVRGKDFAYQDQVQQDCFRTHGFPKMFYSPVDPFALNFALTFWIRYMLYVNYVGSLEGVLLSWRPCEGLNLWEAHTNHD